MGATPEAKARLERAVAFMDELNEQSTAEIVNVLEDTKNRFLSEIDGLTAEQIDFKPSPDRWSIREVALHVAHAIRRVALLQQMFLANKLPENPAPAKTGLMEDDPGDFAEVQKMTAKAFDAALSVGARVDEAPDAEATFPHPWFGPLTCRRWLVFQVLHANVHINQLIKNKNAEGYPA